MRKQQRGMTTIGLIILVAFIGFVGFGVLQLVPMYLENMKVRQVLNGIKVDLDGQKAGPEKIRSALSRQATAQDLSSVSTKKDFVIARSPSGFTVSINYSREVQWVANVYLVTKFEHSVEILR